MSSSAGPVAFGSYHYKVTLPSAPSTQLFLSFTPPTLTLDAIEVKTWDANGKPVHTLTGGTQAQGGTFELGRGVDSDLALYTWFQNTSQTGVTASKGPVTVAVLDQTGTALQTWSFTGCVITSYGQSAGNAQTQELLVENITISYETAALAKS